MDAGTKLDPISFPDHRNRFSCHFLPPRPCNRPLRFADSRRWWHSSLLTGLRARLFMVAMLISPYFSIAPSRP